jgi:hypothetical protein
VIWPENVFDPNPFVARAAKTDWNGRVLNWDAKIPVQVEDESFVTPWNLKDAMDDVAVRFWRLNSDPAGVHICPAAGGDALQPALPLIPGGMKVSSKTVVTPPLAKLMNGVGAKPAPPTISGGFARLEMLPASLPEIVAGISPLGKPKGEISTLPLTAGVAVSWKKMHWIPTGQTPAGVVTPPGPVTKIVPAILKVPLVIIDADIVAVHSIANIAPSTKLFILLPCIA